MAEKANPGTTTGSATAGNVQPSQNGNVPAKPTAGPIPPAPVAAFSGNRGGKPRKDGLVPGSKQAEEADRKKDADRKKLARTTQSQANPPALPSPVAGGAGPGPSPAGHPGPLPAGPVPGQSVPVPWDPNTLKPLLQQVIDGAEQAQIQKRRTQAIAAGLPGPVVEKSAGLAVFPGSAKAGLAASGSNGIAQVMNGLKISGKFQDPAIAVASLASILLSIQQSNAKFEEMIAEFKKSKPAEEPKKP